VVDVWQHELATLSVGSSAYEVRDRLRSAQRRATGKTSAFTQGIPVKVKALFTPDEGRYEGVRPINVFLLRIIYLLMCTMMARTAWSSIVGHQGTWEPYRAMATCVWAAYGTLSLLGLLHPLRMLPVVLFMIFYKSLWLAIVAYPLWRAATLAGSSAEELTYVFLAAPIFALFVPWGHVVRRFVIIRKRMPQSTLAPACRLNR
jgi:hypothetical protein